MPRAPDRPASSRCLKSGKTPCACLQLHSESQRLRGEEVIHLLCVEDQREAVLRVGREEGARDASPARRAQPRRGTGGEVVPALARRADHSAEQAKALERVKARSRAGAHAAELVGPQRRHALAAQQRRHSIQPPVRRQPLCKAEKVASGREEPASAARSLALRLAAQPRRRCVAGADHGVVLEAVGARAAVASGEPSEGVLGNFETRVGHSERLEEGRLEEAAERLAAHLLEDTAEELDRHGVGEGAPGLVHEGKRIQPRRKLVQ
mmetsp:Transcript_41036/g.135964  ORF Transcript_41036/g.135964 Transcript_41036/m.135964 type:complete len:266 (-) Transcript_41036:685-1482(-)